MARIRIAVLLTALSYALWSMPLAASKTVVEFSRPARTCDDFADRSFDGTTKIVYAYGDADPPGNKPTIDLNEASSFGQTAINLATDPFPEPPEDDTKIVDLLMKDFAVPYDELFDYQHSDTNVLVATGWDLYHEIPEADDEHAVHMTKFDFVRAHDEFVHHIEPRPCLALDDEALMPSGWDTLHGSSLAPSLESCWRAATGDNYYIDREQDPSSLHRNGNPHVDSDGLGPAQDVAQFWPIVGSANMKSGAFAKTPSGLSKPVTMPPAAGVLIGGPDRTTGWRYVLMEMHYNLPWYAPPEGEEHENWRPDHMFLDNSGVRVWYTPTLRPYDMGASWIGVDLDTIKWPAAQPAYTVRAPSSTKCALDGRPLDANGEPGELHVSQAFLKLAHQLHGSVTVRHFRDGQELQPLAVDHNYNAAYSQFLNVDATWKHDDVIVVDCELDTAMKDQDHANLCAVKLQYYPAMTKTPLPLFSEDLRHQADNKFYNKYCNDTYFFDPSDYAPLEQKESCPRGLKLKHPKFGDAIARPLLAFDSGAYDVHTYLDLDEKFMLHWRYDVASDVVDFALEVDTDGWVAFGVSSSHGQYSGLWDEYHSSVPVPPEMPAERYASSIRPGLPQSDIVVSWVDDATGTPYFYDNYVDDMLMTHIDEMQDYFRIKAKQDGIAYKLIR